jgi:predicted aspartyl protease
MANELLAHCWQHPNRYVIGIQLMNLNGALHSDSEEPVQIDTGYSEMLLIPYDLFQTLRLKRRRQPAMNITRATTVSGEALQLIEAHAVVLIPKTNEQHHIVVQTFIGNTRFLIGRAFLRRFKVLLDGPGAQTCLID